MAGEKIKLLMPLLRENWGPSLCLLVADCQLALCSFRSAKSHNAFWHDKRQKRWWRARRQLGSWLRSHIMEWKTWTNGKGERKTWEKYHREVWGAGCALWDVPGSSNKEMDYRSGIVQGCGPRTPSGFASCWRLVSVVVHLCFHCLLSLYLGSKPKSKQCASCF